MKLNSSSHYLIIAEPRTGSTALARMVSLKTQLPTLHEGLMAETKFPHDHSMLNKYHYYIDAISPYVDEKNHIRKEMPTLTHLDYSADNFDTVLADYKQKIQTLIKETNKPVIFLTGNPLEIFLSMMEKNFSQITADSDSDDEYDLKTLKENFENIQNCLKENRNAINSLKTLTEETGNTALEITRNDVLSEPRETTNKILTAWDTPVIQEHEALTLCPIVKLTYDGTTSSEAPESLSPYIMTYDDQWTETNDGNTFKPHINGEKERIAQKMKKVTDEIHKLFGEDGVKSFSQVVNDLENI